MFRRIGLALFVTAVLAGCAERVVSPSSSIAKMEFDSRSSIDLSMPTVRLARSLAVAMSDRNIRSSLLSDLHRSRVREHKILASDLVKIGGGREKAAFERSGIASQQLDLKWSGELYAAEVYAPLTRDRRRWEIDSAYLIAVELPGRRVIGFDSTGRHIELDYFSPPSTAVIVVAKRETPKSAFVAGALESGETAIHSDTGSRIALEDETECDPELSEEPCEGNSGGGGSGTPSAPGLYMTQMRVWDEAEPWVRGDPETEVWISGTVTGRYYAIPPIPPSTLSTLGFAPGEFVFPLSCAGRTPNLAAKSFDYNGTGTFGQTVLLEHASEFSLVEEVKGFAGTTLNSRRVAFHAPFIVRIIERDDGGECPTPPSLVLPPFTLTYGWRYPGLFSTPSVNNFASVQPSLQVSDVESYFGITNENDKMGEFVFSSWAEFVSLSSSTEHVGTHAGIRLLNLGVNASSVPVEINPY